MKTIILFFILFSFAKFSFASVVCSYQGNLPYTYHVSGTYDNVIIGVSGDYDSDSSTAVGYSWYYPKIMKKYTWNNGQATIFMRDGVDFIFTPMVGEWNTRQLDGWNTYRAGVSNNCYHLRWGPKDWKIIIGNPTLKIDPKSLIGGNIVFMNEALMKIYAVADTSSSIPPAILPSAPTATIYLSGQIAINSSCSVSPAALDVDFGDVPPSIKNKTVTKTINVNCKNKVSGDVYIAGEKVDIGNNIYIDSQSKQVTFSINIKKNDFSINSSSGVVVLDVGLKIVPPLTGGVYKGVTYLDLRYD